MSRVLTKMAAQKSVSEKRFTIDQLVDEALSVSVNTSSRPNSTRCCRCHDTGSCSNCSCKKAGRSCSHCLPSTQGNCLNYPESEQLTSNGLPVSGSVTTAQLEGPSSGTCSCCRETGLVPVRLLPVSLFPF